MFSSTFVKVRTIIYVVLIGFIITTTFLVISFHEYAYSTKGKTVTGRVTETEIVKQTVQHSRRGIPTHTTEEDILKITYVFSVPERPNYEYHFQNTYSDTSKYSRGDILDVEYYVKEMGFNGVDVQARIKGSELGGLGGYYHFITAASFILSIYFVVRLSMQPTEGGKKSSRGNGSSSGKKSKGKQLLSSKTKRKPLAPLPSMQRKRPVD